MLNSFIQFFSPWRRQLQVPLTGLLLTVGIWAGEAKLMPSNDLEPPATSALVVGSKALGEVAIIAKRDALQNNASTGKLPEKDGIYLYGQSPEPEQIGQEYMVFEVRQGKVIGAIYMPHSEFSCFYGTLQSGKLAMMVASSPDDAEAYPDPVAGSNSQQVATANNKPHTRDGYNPIASPYSVALQDYHQLASVSANDQRILETCKAN